MRQICLVDTIINLGGFSHPPPLPQKSSRCENDVEKKGSVRLNNYILILYDNIIAIV